MIKYTNQAYLRAEDLLKGGVYVSRELEVEDIVTDCPLQRKQKLFHGIGLKFKGAEKVLGLGVTNEGLMKVICGDADPKTWVGHKVKLEVRRVKKAGGGTQPAIRIIPEKGTELRSGLVKELGEPICSS